MSRKEYSKKYYQANKEKIKEKRIAYYQANEEMIKEKRRIYYEANKGKRREYFIEYYKKNRKSKSIYDKTKYSRKNNPGEMEVLRINILQATGIDIKEQNRKRGLIDVKRIFSTIARREKKYALQEIGDYLKKTHATVIHHIKTCDDLRLTDKEFNQKYLTIENILKS